MRGLLDDPRPNSLSWHHKNCMAGSKENYKWDPRSERVNCFDSTLVVIFFFLCVNCFRQNGYAQIIQIYFRYHMPIEL